MINKQKETGKKIKIARATADLSQEDLGLKLNYDRQVIMRMEAGTRKIGIEEIKRIAEATGTPIEFFLEEEPEIKVATNHSEDILDLRGLTESRKEFMRKLKEEFQKENAK